MESYRLFYDLEGEPYRKNILWFRCFDCGHEFLDLVNPENIRCLEEYKDDIKCFQCESSNIEEIK